MKIPLLSLFLLLTLKLYAQKPENNDLRLIQGTWVCNENKELIYIIKNDTITDLYLDPYSCKKYGFRLVKELVYEDKTITTNEGEKLLVIYSSTTNYAADIANEDDKIEEIYFIEALDEKRLTLMAYNNLQIVTFKKSKKKIVPENCK